MSTPPHHPKPSPESDKPHPETPLDAALLLTQLRRLLLAWRERATTAHEREARIYRQVEIDLADVISHHSEMRSIWRAARHDLVRAVVAALDEREGRR